MRLAARRKGLFLFAGVSFVVLFASILALLLMHPAVKSVAYPALTAQDLLTNPSLAKAYNVRGMLIVSALSGNANITSAPGQSISATFKLRFISYDPSLASVVVTFAPKTGQVMVGNFDVSSLESVTPASVTVGSQTSLVQLTLKVPSTAAGVSFSLVPDGLTISPYVGIVVYYQSQDSVVVS